MFENPRLVYRVTLKVLTGLAVMVLLWVFIQSLFVNTDNDKSNQVVSSDESQVTILDISDMKNEELRKIRWNSREVLILHRRNPRSNETEYFVYENHGDSGHCPLFYVGNTFKDVCTGKLFDIKGREKFNPEQGYRLITPPHYIENRKIFLGIRNK